MAKKRFVRRKIKKTPTRNFDDPKYKAWRQAVKKRDNHECKWPGCGKHAVYCHHIIKWASSVHLRYRVSNGICLCYKHHKQVTGKEEQYAAFLFGLIRTRE